MNLNRLKIRHFIWVLACLLIFISSVWVFLYWQTTGKMEKTAIELVKSQQLVLTRSGALSINNLLRDFKVELLLLAEKEDLKILKEKEGREILDLSARGIRDKKGLTTSIGLVDAAGKIIWGTNTKGERQNEEVMVADRDYFLWARQQKEAGAVFITSPFISRGGINKDKRVISLVTPVFDQDKFNGLVFISFSVPDLIGKYISPLAYSPDVYTFLISQDGNIVGSSLAGLGEKNIKDYLDDSSWLTKNLLSGNEGSLVYSGNSFSESGKKAKFIAAYTPIQTEETKLIILISYPYQEVIRNVNSIRIFSFSNLTFGLLGTLIICLVFILALRLTERRAFIDGFKNGRSGFKKD